MVCANMKSPNYEQEQLPRAAMNRVPSRDGQPDLLVVGQATIDDIYLEGGRPLSLTTPGGDALYSTARHQCLKCCEETRSLSPVWSTSSNSAVLDHNRPLTCGHGLHSAASLGPWSSAEPLGHGCST